MSSPANAIAFASIVLNAWLLAVLLHRSRLASGAVAVTQKGNTDAH